MPALARVVGLYCGQGMAHLVEIYDSGVAGAVADHLVLVDFGGDLGFSDDAVNYVFARLKAQSDAGRTAKFDLTVISHQDEDHVVLLDSLADKITDESLTVQFGQVFLGGLEWSDENKATVDKFFGISRTRPRYDWDARQRSDYHGVTSRARLGKLAEFSGFYFRILISQFAAAGKADIRRNASSTVLVIENGTQSVILPGDATYHTMNWVNGLYEAWGTSRLIPSVRALEVPHHGAIRTAVQNYVASKQSVQLNMTIIKAFAAYLNPDVVFASAGYLNNHGHPVQEIFEVFQPHTVMVKDHVYVAFVFNDNKSWTKKERYEEFTTDDAIVTTLVGISAGPVWKNVTIRLPTADAATAVSNRHSLRELLVMDGIEPPPGMGTTPFSATDGTPASPAPPSVYAPAPTAAEREPRSA